MVKRTGEGFECTLCGEKLPCGPDERPVAVIVQSSGRPTVRSILVRGEEIHRCRVGNLMGGRPRRVFP